MKSLSRLNGGLLARKGTAAPSTDLRPEAGSLDRIGEPLPFSRKDDDVTPSPAEEKVQSVYTGVHSRPRISIRKAMAQKKVAEAAAKKRAENADRVAMTVRMDEDQHVKLKVYCAHMKKSAQEVFLEALDNFIDSHQNDVEMANCACFRKAKNPPQE